MLLSRRAATAWRAQKASVSASLRQGIRMVTNSSLIVCMLPKWLRGLAWEERSSVAVFCGRRCGFGWKVEGKGVERGVVEFAPPGGDGIGSGHQAGVEVADEDFSPFAADDFVGLAAIWHGDEVWVEWPFGLVDFGEDADAGEARPVDIVETGAGADAGDGVAGADAEIVEGVGGLKGFAIVPSCRVLDE